MKTKLPLGHTWSDIEFNCPEDMDDIKSTEVDFSQPLSEKESSVAGSKSEINAKETRVDVEDDIAEEVTSMSNNNDDSATMSTSDLLNRSDEKATKNSSTQNVNPNTIPLDKESDRTSGSDKLSSTNDTSNLPPFTQVVDAAVSTENSDISDNFNKLCDISGIKSSESVLKTSISSTNCDDSYFSDDYQASFLSDEELNAFRERRKKKRKKRRSNTKTSWITLDKQIISESLNVEDVSPDRIGPGPDIILQVFLASYIPEKL